MTDVEVERPPMVAALSPSSISMWKQCPRRFFYEKIMRLETEPGLEAVCGSFVHEVLEHLMSLPAGERTSESARRLAAERWAAFTADPETRFADLDLDPAATKDFKRRAWAGITGYFDIEDPNRVDVVATEQEMEADLDGAPLFGIVDRLERWGDRLVVSDYKTGKAPKWDEEVEEKLDQLRLYAAILEAHGTPVSTLRLLFLSPQLGARSRSERCAAQALTAWDALEVAMPGVAPDGLVALVDAVADAHRAARESADPGEDRPVVAERAKAAALDAAWEAAQSVQPADPEVAAQRILDVVAARRRAWFAHRDAERSRPKEIVIEVLPEHITAARAEVAEVWAEASACYEAWEFPTHTGPLCGWCPFADQCEGYTAWAASQASAAS